MQSVISSYSYESLGVPLAARVHAGGSAPSSSTWPSANLALGVPLNLDRDYTITTLWWANGAAVAGNVDVGIYTLSGARLTSSGSIAQAGTNVVQPFALGTPLTVPAGAYMMFLACSSTTSQFWRHGTTAVRNAKMLGMVQLSGAIPLPAQATFTATASTYLPLFGITRVTYF